MEKPRAACAEHGVGLLATFLPALVLPALLRLGLDAPRADGVGWELSFARREPSVSLKAKKCIAWRGWKVTSCSDLGFQRFAAATGAVSAPLGPPGLPRAGAHSVLTAGPRPEPTHQAKGPTQSGAQHLLATSYGTATWDQYIVRPEGCERY